MKFFAVALFVAGLAAAASIDLDVRSQEAADAAYHALIPAPEGCRWSGTSPFCAGGCESYEKECRTDSCGDGACCVTGYKKLCCRSTTCPP